MKKQKLPLIALVAGLFMAAGIFYIVQSHAATPFVAAETEKGTLRAPAATVADASASGGSAVAFAATGGGSSPSGAAMPVGNLPGWTQNLAEDFKTDATPAQFDATYKNSWCGYGDGTGGKYYKSTVSATGGMQRITLDGTKGAAGVYGSADSCWSRLYGRFSMRLKATGAAENGTAVMVWPSSDVWSDGEIDYPEGNFDDQIHVFHHPTPCDLDDIKPPAHCGSSDGLATGASWQTWHTVATEWTPSSVKYYLDDKLVKTVTHDVPTTNHRYMMQVAPNGSNPKAGTFDIDWVTVYAYTP